MNSPQTSPTDETTKVEALLRQSMPDAVGVRVNNLAPMFGGNSRKAWSFDASWQRGGNSVTRPCVMLSQLGHGHVESDIRREFQVLSGLNGKGVRVPEAIAIDVDGEIVGAPSIVLERINGKANAVAFLKSPDVEASTALTEDLALVVAQLHRVEWSVAAFDPALASDTPRQLVERQVQYWEKTFLANRLEPLPVMASLFAWLKKNIPTPERICMVHGDLRPGNFLYEGPRVTGLLDWEMAHFGDPIEDLGWIYRPLWSPKRFVPLRKFVDLYAKHSGCDISWSSVIFYRVFSELKFATISLTAAKSFATGQTLNLRHADRAATVTPCLKRCLDWIETQKHEVAHA